MEKIVSQCNINILAGKGIEFSATTCSCQDVTYTAVKLLFICIYELYIFLPKIRLIKLFICKENAKIIIHLYLQASYIFT